MDKSENIPVAQPNQWGCSARSALHLIYVLLPNGGDLM